MTRVAGETRNDPPAPPLPPLDIMQPSAGCRYLVMAGPWDEGYDDGDGEEAEPIKVGWECAKGAYVHYDRALEVAGELHAANYWTQIVDLKTLSIVFRTDTDEGTITIH